MSAYTFGASYKRSLLLWLRSQKVPPELVNTPYGIQVALKRKACLSSISSLDDHTLPYRPISMHSRFWVTESTAGVHSDWDMSLLDRLDELLKFLIEFSN